MLSYDNVFLNKLRDIQLDEELAFDIEVFACLSFERLELFVLFTILA